MNCNLQKEKRGVQGFRCETGYVASIFSECKNNVSKTQSDALDLNNYLFHAVGSYTGRENIFKRIKSILKSGAILCEDFQSLVCDKDIVHINEFSISPKLNGKNRISICQKDSFMEEEENSRSYEMYVKSGVSFILDKDLLDDLEVFNEFVRSDRWRWLDGELRVEGKIPSEYFVGIAFPCEDHVTRLEKMKKCGYHKDLALKYFKEDFFQVALKEIEQYIKENNLNLPLYSIVTGKPMGNLEEEFNKAFGESEEEYGIE